MPDYKAFLSKLHQNLNILQEREAKYGGNVPLELINQINDHQVAINLTERAIRGTVGESDWREALQPLLIAIQTRTGELASTISLGDIQGGIHQSTIGIAGRDVTQITLVRLFNRVAPNPIRKLCVRLILTIYWSAPHIFP
ncbi:MAG: hypothetical protein U0401_28925 [Anaerolineae bacterium]